MLLLQWSLSLLVVVCPNPCVISSDIDINLNESVELVEDKVVVFSDLEVDSSDSNEVTAVDGFE